MDRGFAGPFTLTPYLDGGGFVVTFPGLPEAITQGDTLEECLDEAQGALKAALGCRVHRVTDHQVRGARPRLCIGCGKCIDACPLECISLQGDGIVVEGNCIGCGLCSVNCPVSAIEMKELVPMKDDLLDTLLEFARTSPDR